MDRFSVYLFERGLPRNIPGFKENFPAAAFPFWGNFYFLDFALANFRGAQVSSRLVAVDSRYRSQVFAVAGRWESETPEVRLLENGPDDLLKWLAADPAEFVILSSLSFVTVFDAADLMRAVAGMESDLIKVSVGHIPVDLFVSRRERLQRLLEESRQRVVQSKTFEQFLFEDILLTSFELIEDIPGRVLFHNSIRQLARENLWLLGNMGSADHQRILSRMVPIRAPDRETVIESGAFIRNSLIGSGAQVEGYVEDSLIFPNVHVRKGARIVQSVVMSNNRIGSRTTIENTLILPCSPDGSKYASNIGEGATIGAVRSAAQNEEYPQEIRSGMTVLGMDVEVPGGITVEPGCLIAADVSHQQLRGLKKLKRGSSVYPQKRR
jgi:hypothetical protein